MTKEKAPIKSIRLNEDIRWKIGLKCKEFVNARLDASELGVEVAALKKSIAGRIQAAVAKAFTEDEIRVMDKFDLCAKTKHLPMTYDAKRGLRGTFMSNNARAVVSFSEHIVYPKTYSGSRDDAWVFDAIINHGDAELTKDVETFVIGCGNLDCEADKVIEAYARRLRSPSIRTTRQLVKKYPDMEVFLPDEEPEAPKKEKKPAPKPTDDDKLLANFAATTEAA